MSQQNTYHPQTAKFIATMCQNMPKLESKIMQEYIENPQELQRVLEVAFTPSQVSISPKPCPYFPIWKTIQLGIYKDAKKLHDQLISQDYLVSKSAQNVMNLPKFKLQTSKIEVDLVKISLEGLGFTERPTLMRIYCRAIESGLLLCPDEVGPALRIEHDSQTHCEGWLRIAMEPIVDRDGNQNIFTIGRIPTGFWLQTDAFVDFFKETYPTECRFIFIRPRKYQNFF